MPDMDALTSPDMKQKEKSSKRNKTRTSKQKFQNKSSVSSTHQVNWYVNKLIKKYNTRG